MAKIVVGYTAPISRLPAQKQLDQIKNAPILQDELVLYGLGAPVSDVTVPVGLGAFKRTIKFFITPEFNARFPGGPPFDLKFAAFRHLYENALAALVPTIIISDAPTVEP